MNQSYSAKLEKWVNNTVEYLQEKKQQMYKKNKSSATINTLRLIFAVILFIIAVYAGSKVIVYGVILGALIVAGYFLVPPDYIKKDFPKMADKVKKEAVELSVLAKEGAVSAAKSVKDVASKTSDGVKKGVSKISPKSKSPKKKTKSSNKSKAKNKPTSNTTQNTSKK